MLKYGCVCVQSKWACHSVYGLNNLCSLFIFTPALKFKGPLSYWQVTSYSTSSHANGTNTVPPLWFRSIGWGSLSWTRLIHSSKERGWGTWRLILCRLHWRLRSLPYILWLTYGKRWSCGLSAALDEPSTAAQRLVLPNMLMFISSPCVQQEHFESFPLTACSLAR